MARPISLKIVSLSVAFIVALAMAVQYPLSTSFPIGGDAPFHVEGGQKILNVFNNPPEALSALQETWYPASHIIFSASGLLPISWPERFTWFMSLGHLFTGLSIAALLWRLSGWKSAMIGLWIWALTTTGITRHFEDGTMAQLWSLGLAALYFERLTAKSTLGSILLFIITSLTHPITGLILLVSSLVTLPSMWMNKSNLDQKEKKQLYGITIIGAISIISIIFMAPALANTIIEGASDTNIVDLMGLYFAPFIVIAPIGGIILATNKNLPLLARTSIGAFASLSLLLAANNLVGINVWTERLRSQFVIVTTILAAIALPNIISAIFKKESLKILVIILILFPPLLDAWKDNDRVYRFYENEDNYARPRLGEIADIEWMANNLPKNSTIYSAISDRTTEWIPLLTNHIWKPNSNIQGTLEQLTTTPAKTKIKRGDGG